jgi:hypothetical protein
MMLITPNVIHHHRPSWGPAAMPVISAATPWMIHVIPSQVQVPDQDHARHDEQQAGDAEPEPVPLGRVEHPDQVEDAGDDQEDAEQHGDDVERARRVSGDDDPDDHRHDPEEQTQLPRPGSHGGGRRLTRRLVRLHR